jgi:protein-S-isoprenylcysteine O-methyltransferase Ste14
MAEERRNLIKFGAEHAAYVQTTRRLIPLIY